MGISLSSRYKQLSETEKELSVEVEEWLQLRQRTINELSRVANELDSLHKTATYSKIAGGIAGAIGGGIALSGLALSFFTGGTSLFLTGTGLTIAAGGGVTATVAEIVEYLKKRTRIDCAQKALEKDKTAQAALLSKVEKTIDTSDFEPVQKDKVKARLRDFVDSVQKVWFSGIKM